MIYHCIRYTLDARKFADFETYSRRWTDGGIIRRLGGDLLGYFLPRKGYGGADNTALALIGFDSLSAYEAYRERLERDPEALENMAFARQTGCVLFEERSYCVCLDGMTNDEPPNSKPHGGTEK